MTVAVPVCPAAGVRVSVGALPVPVTEIPEAGTSVALLDVADTTKADGADSASPTANPTGWVNSGAGRDRCDDADRRRYVGGGATGDGRADGRLYEVYVCCGDGAVAVDVGAIVAPVTEGALTAALTRLTSDAETEPLALTSPLSVRTVIAAVGSVPPAVDATFVSVTVTAWALATLVRFTVTVFAKNVIGPFTAPLPLVTAALQLLTDWSNEKTSVIPVARSRPSMPDVAGKGKGNVVRDAAVVLA